MSSTTEAGPALPASRPGSEVLAQHFMFLALGKEGYGDIHAQADQVAAVTRWTAAGPATGGTPQLQALSCPIPIV